jgi:hypothetical protein
MKTSLLTVLLIFAATGCATTTATKEMEAIQKEGVTNTVAWYQAREILRSMCSGPTKTNTKAYLCEPRLIKTSNNPSTDDWKSVNLPPYEVIVDVHESTLRAARGSLRFYEDAMFALSHALAKRVDAGEITQQQFKLAWNEGWKWMYSQLQNDYALLQQNIALAKQADANTWQTIGTVVVGLAAVAGAVIIADAQIRAENYRSAAIIAASQPQPRTLNCNAYRTGNLISVQCN